jgi:hypothetical protein
LRPGRRVVARTFATGSIARSAPAAGTASPWPRWASGFEGLLLLGRQDLVELSFGLLFEFGNLFLLILREVQLLDRERRDQMEPAGTTVATRSTGTIPPRRATGVASVRTARRAVLRSRSQGKGGHCDDAENRDECWKTPHGDTSS